MISDLGDLNLHDKFQFLKLPDSSAAVQLSRIGGDSSCVTVSQPLTASGTFNNPWISAPVKGKIVR